MVVGESLEGKKVSCVASSLVVLVCGFPFLEYRFVMFCNATQIGVSRHPLPDKAFAFFACLVGERFLLSLLLLLLLLLLLWFVGCNNQRKWGETRGWRNKETEKRASDGWLLLWQ